MNNLISEPTKTQLKKYNDLISMMKDFGSVAVACLSSRFVYGETISREKLGMVDKAEQLLLDSGLLMYHWT